MRNWFHMESDRLIRKSPSPSLDIADIEVDNCLLLHLILNESTL